MNILGFILLVSGLLVVTYFSGPKSSSEQKLVPSPAQGQVTALPINSPSPTSVEPTVTIRNKKTGEVKQVPKSQFDYAGTKQAGYSDAVIQNYLTSKSQPQATKASDKALRLSAYIFTFSNEKTRNELINKFSNGKGDLSLAVNNLALLLDSKPEALALAEKNVAQDLANKKSQEESSAIVEYNRKEYERLKAEIDSIPKSTSYTYTGGTQNTNVKPNLLKETKPEYTQRSNTYIGRTQDTNVEPILPKETNPKPGFIQKGSQYTDSFGNTYFTNADGTTGSAYTDSFGNTNYNDSSGYSSSTYRDSFGNSYTTDNQGRSVNSYTDSFGNTQYNSSNGLFGSSYTDSFGNTQYNDNHGNNIRCYTDSFGNKTCN